MKINRLREKLKFFESTGQIKFCQRSKINGSAMIPLSVNGSIRETEKAFGIQLQGFAKLEYFPKSMVFLTKDHKTLMVPMWLLTKKKIDPRRFK